MDRALAEQARSLLASARAWLVELHEEGVEAVESAPAAPRVEGVDTGPRDEAVDASPRVEPAGRGVAAVPPDPGQPQLDLLGGGATSPAERPTLESVRAALGDCTRCRLCEGRQQIVFGDGNPNADLVFVGEGPGAEEDRRGLPFVGRAGELLTQMIEKGLSLRRSDVYICNIVKCRPPDNRTPLADEAATCRPFLDGQLAAIRPRVIVALGKPAASLLLGRDVAISRVRGIWHDYRGTPLMPTFHPAFVLRQYTPENRRLVWEDLKAALQRSRE
jgi:DNA polymerase